MYRQLEEAELSEKEKIEKFIVDTCKCKLAERGGACSTIIILSVDDFYNSQNKCQELSSAEFDLVVLGVMYSTASDPRPQMIPRPQVIPKMDRK